MNPRQGFFALLIAIFAVTSMLVPSGPAMGQKRGGKLVYMIPASDAPSLDGHRETTFATVHATAPFYSLLIRVDPKSKLGKEIAGDLATEWTVSKDQLTYTFKILQGVKFHDGSTLTSKDVLASWNHIVFPPEGVVSPRRNMFAMVQSITAPDPETVVFKLKFPSSAFLPGVSIPFNYIYSAAKLEQDPHFYEKNVMGSGPFRLVEYTPGSRIVGERFADYHRKELPYLDGIEAIYTPKQNVQVQAIRGGRAHSMFRGLPPAARDDLVRAMGEGVVAQESTWNCALLFSPNSFRKPWDDVRARRALNLALDRWGGSRYLSRIGIVKTVGGAAFPGHPLAPTQSQLKSLEGFWPDINNSRELAKQLLKEAGVPEGYKFTFMNRNTDQPYKVVGTWLIDQFRQIGLNVEQEVVPTAQMYQRLRMPNGGDWEAAMHFNCQSLVNPTVDIAAYTSGSDQNYADFNDPVVDELFEKQMREPDPVKQKEMLWKMQQAITAQAGTIPTLWWHRTVVHSSKMKFWEVTPSHYLNMQLETVWLDQ